MKPVPYSHVINGIRTGDLIEWRSPRPLGWLIRFFSGQYVNHTSVVSDHDTIIESDIGGVKQRCLSDILRGYTGEAFWLPLRPIHNPCRPYIKEASEGYLGRGYDYAGLLAQMFKRVSLDGAMFFCSELAHQVYADVGLLPKRTTALQPGEFLRWNPPLFATSKPHGVPIAMHSNQGRCG